MLAADNNGPRLAYIDHGKLAAARASAAQRTGQGTGRLTLNIAEDVVLEAMVEHTAPTSSGGYSLSGRIGKGAGTMTWIANGELVMGTIWTPDAVYDVLPLVGGIHAIRKVDRSMALPLGEPLKADIDTAIDSTVAEARKDDGSIVDVLVLWTPAVSEAAGGEGRIRSAIDFYMATANNVLRDSGTTLQVRLVGATPVDYMEALGRSGTDLKRLRDPTDGFMDDIHARRNELGADLVSLITDNTDVGGIAYVMQNLRLGFASHAFSVATYSNILYFTAMAFVHELGHNMGLAHDRFVSPQGGILPFSHGYVNALAFESGAVKGACWHTIMAYADRCKKAGFGRRVKVPYFSTPLIRYPSEDGDPMGVPKTSDVEGRDGPADAVRSLEEARLVVANFRSEHADDGDTPDAATAVASSSVTLAELGGEGDEDYFRIELTEPGTLRVESTGTVDTVGTLSGEAGEVLAKDDDGGAGRNFLIQRDVAAGTYFVKVEGFNTGAYALVISFHPASEADDHGDMPSSATAVTIPSTTEAVLDGANDVDYFRFELSEHGVLEAKTSGSADTVGTLRRADGEILISDDDSGPGGNFTIVGKFGIGTYYLAVRSFDERSIATTLNISFDPNATDDHGDSASTASALSLPTAIDGELEVPMDLDYFRIEAAGAGTLRLGTSGDTDTMGMLTTADGSLVASNDDDPNNWPNFGIVTPVAPGVYFLKVVGWHMEKGPYVLDASLERTAATAPLFIADSHATQQGFARVVNRSDQSGTVTVRAIDDSGKRFGPLRLAIAAGQTRHFNSADLESGKRANGMEGAAGDGEGNWRLEFRTDLDIEVHVYVRTKDGFLTSMHDVVPPTPNDEGMRYRVVTFNPGRNRKQVSKLRLINPGREAAEIAIRAIDDNNAPAPAGEVALILPAGHSRTVTAQDLEAGAEDLDGRLGEGAGKWELIVDANAPLVVMNLLESRSGHLANLSTPTGNRTSIPLFMCAMCADPPDQQGFLRVINRSDEAGTVAIQAIDDAGVAPPPVTLAIGARRVRHFNSDDLETGASAKGLSDGVGRPSAGNWRLELSTPLDIEAYSYVRTKDGFLASMHGLAPSNAQRHEVVIFNPGSNENRASRLRLINPGSEDAQVVVSAVDDDGRAGEAKVALALPAGRSKELTAQQLEAGGEGFNGRFGDGAGKWRLAVAADQTIRVMSLLEAKTGNLANLSSRAANGAL